MEKPQNQGRESDSKDAKELKHKYELFVNRYIVDFNASVDSKEETMTVTRKKIWDCTKCNMMHDKRILKKIKKAIKEIIIEESI